MTVATNQNDLSELGYIAPDGGWGWVVAISSLIIHLIMDGLTYSLGTYLTVFTEYFKVSHGEASIVHSLLPAITLMCGPIASIFTNKFGCRWTTVIGSVIASFGFLLSYFVHRFYFLYITIGLIVGLGFGLIYVPAIVSVGFYFDKKRSFAIGIAVCGSGLGTFLLAPINRILVNNYGIQGAFLIKSAVILNMIVCGLLMRPVPVEPSEINKRNKKLAKQKNIVENKPLLNNIDKPEIVVTDEKNRIISSDSNDTKNPASKMGESMPVVYSKSENRRSMNINIENHQEIDPNAFAKSMPMLAENGLSHVNKSIHGSRSQMKGTNSALDIMAHVRSSQSIHRSTNFIDKTDHQKPHVAIQTSNQTMQKKSLKEKINNMIDISLFKDPVFIFFAISNFLTSLGFNAPFIYIVDQATLLNIKPELADLLLSTIGISNTVGRVILGIISNLKGMNRLYLYAGVLTMCGLATMAEPFGTNFIALFIYAIVFGFTSGGYVSLTSVLLVDLLGLEKLTNAFGMLLVFQGTATLIGPPAVGIMFDIFHSYTLPFLFTGLMIAISGFMCFFIPCFQKK